MRHFLLLVLAVVFSPAAAQVPLVEAYAMADDVAEAMLEGDNLYQGCSLACAYGWTTTATSHLTTQGDNRYDVGMLEDGSARTAWVEGADGDGVGERLVFAIEEGTPGDETGDVGPVPFWGINLVNGYAKDDETWQRNGRVHEFLLLINDEPAALLKLVDTYLPQVIDLPPGVEVVPGDVVALEIRSVYPGTRYADTAIAELVLHGAH